MSMAPTTLEEPVAIRANPQPRIERTALEKALSLTDVDMVRRAIANGADVNLPFSDALTPLCRAAAVGERRILKQLLLAKADVDRTAKRVSAGSSMRLTPPYSLSRAPNVEGRNDALSRSADF